MKKLLLLISFAISFLYSFTQIDVQRDNRVNPVLKLAVTQKSGYITYGRPAPSRFINIAVLNQTSHTVSWFTCHGRLFDSTKLTDREYELVTSKQLDPFILYQNICDKYLAGIAAAKDIYRVYGDKQLFDRLHANYRALFAMASVQAAKTPLQKLIAVENVRKSILTQLAYLNCGNPAGLTDNPLYKNNREQAGVMLQTKDSTVYYNIDPASAVTKISLYKASPEKLYVYNRLAELIDSVSVLPEKYDLLLKEKTDIFLLYRGWLEMQWQGAMGAIRRHRGNAGIYSRANTADEQAIEKELYNQLNAIGTKINLLNSPEAKSIEQAVYETYRNETSEISYMPLLGIGYDLVQRRGDKQYELTNHLGNVLATMSDKKNGVPSASNSSLIDHYEPDIVNAQDYYPFGMLQPGRSYLSPTGDKYRYGFNDKENDNEVKGEGEQQDYGMRVYDPRVGRFLSVDPLTKQYPWYTPYQFAGNSPIKFVDLDGLEPAEKGTSEGQVGQSNAVIHTGGGHYETYKKTWYWHGGGLRNAKGQLTKADWYSSDDYVEVLSNTNAAKALGSALGLYTAAASSMGGNDPLSKEELSKFVGKGLGNEAYKHLVAGAKANAKYANTYVSGKVEPSSFNVEDLIGAGLLLKEGVRYLGGLAAKNILTKEGSQLANTIDDFVKLFTPKDEYDAVKTLYRGTTGSEGGGTMIFLTDNESVARSYVKNGGQVMSYEVSEYSLFNLRQRGMLTVMEDIHSTGQQAIRHTTYQFTGSNVRSALNQIAKPTK